MSAEPAPASPYLPIAAPDARRRWRDRISRLLFGSIRSQIILPFLVLTAVVAVIGTFVVTRLVAANVQDRLTTQLVDTSRAASDSLVDWERQHLDRLRLVVFTAGVPEALASGDGDSLAETLSVLAQNQHMSRLLGVSADGTVIADVQRVGEAYLDGDLGGGDLGGLPAVAQVLAGQQDAWGDKRATLAELGGEWVLLTVAPVRTGPGEIAGAVAIATPLDDLLAGVKMDVLGDLTLYDASGRVLATTFAPVGEDGEAGLRLQPALVEEALRSPEEAMPLREIVVNGRAYQTAYVPLQVRGAVLGVLAVSLPSTIVQSLITTNRLGLTALFSLVSALVVAAGYAVAHSLSTPVRRLAGAAEAVSAGDLTVQSGVSTPDEIGLLGRTFDAMTVKLGQQRQALEEAYLEQQREAAFLSAVLMSAGDGLLVLARDGEVARANPLARDVLMADEMVWSAVLGGLLRQVAGGSSVARSRVEVAGQWFEALAAPVRTPDGGEIGVVVTLRDVTDQVTTERMRTSFLMQISHELRTPLTGIKGYTELAYQFLEGGDAQVREFLTHAISNVDALTLLIDRILDVTQLINGQIALEWAEFDAAALLTEVAGEYRDRFTAKPLEMVVEAGPGLCCPGDRARLKWALSQLVDNAFNYTLPHGRVVLAAERRAGEIALCVTDTGVGISRRDGPRIFEEFYRGTAETADGRLLDVRGAGLGLFIVERIISAHGGAVDVESQVGEGSEFTLRLPAGRGAGSGPSAATAAAPGGEHGVPSQSREERTHD